MDVIISSLHTIEELPTELDLRLACKKAEEAELKAQQIFDANPTMSNFRACRKASRVVIDMTAELCDFLAKAMI